MEPKQAYNYFADAKKKVGTAEQAPVAPQNDQAAVDQLLDVARKLGWDRVRKITDAITGS
jgi:hypothetical protein